MNYDPSFETFNPAECGQPMVEAVQALAERLERPFDSFVGTSLTELAAEAEAAYWDGLPEFWRIWKEWHAPQPPPEMGDL